MDMRELRGLMGEGKNHYALMRMRGYVFRGCVRKGYVRRGCVKEGVC